MLPFSLCFLFFLFIVYVFCLLRVRFRSLSYEYPPLTHIYSEVKYKGKDKTQRTNQPLLNVDSSIAECQGALPKCAPPSPYTHLALNLSCFHILWFLDKAVLRCISQGAEASGRPTYPHPPPRQNEDGTLRLAGWCYFV